jgi:hypothetical protein
MLGIIIPEFYDDTITEQKGETKQAKRDVCFDLTDDQGQNLCVDVDNQTRARETAIQVWKSDKEQVLTTIETWVKNNSQVVTKWNANHQYDTKTYRLDPQSRSLATQLSAIAISPKAKMSPKLPPVASLPKASNHPVPNAWLDLTKVKEAMFPTPRKKATTNEDEATITTLSESTIQSSSISRS